MNYVTIYNEQKEKRLKRAKNLLTGLIMMMALAANVQLRQSLMAPLAAHAQAAAPRSFVTKHTGTFNGQRINYVATVGETILKDEAGAATASIFSTSYVREGVNDKARRPVIFAFNGGPGASSTFLHMGALGPKRVVFPADLNAEIAPPYKLADNNYALLDVADLVLNETALKAFTDDLRAFVSPPTFDAAIRPVRGGGPEVTAVEFRMELRGTPNSKAQPFSLQVPITYAGRTGIADRVDSLVVRDSSGVVALKVEDDPADPGGFPYFRHWRAERAIAPPVVVTYRMRSFTGVATRGPQFDFYSHNGGISSGGMALFVLPEKIGIVSSRVKWDLTDLAPGSIAASTYGEGDFDLRGPVERLMQAYYMAGPLGRYAPPESTSGFCAYWLGQPAFDPPKEMAWTYQAYEYLRKFYRDATTTSYRVFVRALPGTGGGAALQNSFMFGTAPGAADPTKTGPRGTLAHEIGHMWVGGLSGGGVGGTTWFNEGLNVHYTRLLLLRSGLAPVSDYERDINQTARAYYASPYRNTSADELARLGFSRGVGAGSSQNVPYTRGSLYFADVDARIRAASGGRRKLDDVILALFERRSRGEDISADMLLDALVKEIGPAAREQFEAVIMRGETIVPEPGAFGPCFERRPAKFEVEGKEVEGFEWTRAPSVPETRCREW